MTQSTASLIASPDIAPPAISRPDGSKLVVQIVGAVAVAHLLNDLIQAVLPAIYPMLKEKYRLSFGQIGWIALVYQFTASLLQPWIGLYTDKRPLPYLLPLGMVVTLAGIGGLAIAGSYAALILASAVIGVGSATFHPEASRVARMASGGRFGTAQSAFQVGGNTGSALGPIIASAIVLPFGQTSVGWLAFAAIAAIWVLFGVTRWRVRHSLAQAGTAAISTASPHSRREIVRALSAIGILMFAKFIYIGAFTNYFTFYLIERFDLTARESQFYLFCFLAAVAVGTFAGGPVGDRIGRKAVIWASFLGVAPFAMVLPHANLFWTAGFAILIGLIMSSAFAALVVYAQELVPGRVGLVSGLMFGLMFGISGLGAAGLGQLADLNGIVWVYKFCAYLPLLGLATILLPSFEGRKPRDAEVQSSTAS
ncbi:MFS transporter [Sphingomonas koreensis]|uniref:MFS transporter n=1 Tax=Sphingomonas koreensis TaxID=93064 RepID=A0A1L6J5S3_9SPHN|nr:MFS transporter [Sphingomonas koreensis]APR51302.1 MFS transporter [Sphingomonas koreensis]MDC7810364.1 MFS transporter [Sphingomonas koreensis]RSU17026.1 MFS transporter [Sphingomonas koreensis]RSU21845.1 MFS transporter [Sphingomonas koreensis]RSU26212.1 MFS transporter [Sphingomonas koreensis]